MWGFKKKTRKRRSIKEKRHHPERPGTVPAPSDDGKTTVFLKKMPKSGRKRKKRR